MLYQLRLSKILSKSFDPLRIDEVGTTRGSHLRLDGAPMALGRLISEGAEAAVYELVDLRVAELHGVVKLCKHPPGTPAYRTWAVPFRFERNPYSAKPDIELQPARLIEIPGGLVKVQDYVPDVPGPDWATRAPARSILVALKEQGHDAALARARELIAMHGPRGILHEMEGRLLHHLERLDEACIAYAHAMDGFRQESRAGLFRTGIRLAEAYREIYRADRYRGASAVTTIKLPGGGTASQVFYSDPVASAREDSLEDRSLYTLLEILAVEPCLIPALFMLAEELASSAVSMDRVVAVLDAIEHIEPGREDVREFRRSHKDYIEQYCQIGSRPEQPPVGEAPPTEHVSAESTPASPPSPHSNPSMTAFEQNYQPEPNSGQVAQARMESARANMALGRFAQAEKAARDAAALVPDLPDAHRLLAQVLCTADRPQEAMEVLQQAIGRLPHAADLYEAAGWLHLEEERYEEASTAFLRALVSGPTTPWHSELGLGRAYRGLGRREQALSHLWTAYDTAGDIPIAALQLAYVLREKAEDSSPEDLHAALHVIRSALETCGDDVELLVCLAQLLCMDSQYALAAEVLRRAVSLRPDHPVAAGLLAALERNHA